MGTITDKAESLLDDIFEWLIEKVNSLIEKVKDFWHRFKNWANETWKKYVEPSAKYAIVKAFAIGKEIKQRIISIKDNIVYWWEKTFPRPTISNSATLNDSWEAAMKQLIDLGFTPEQAREALTANGTTVGVSRTANMHS